MKVIVTDADFKQSLCVTRSLGAKGIEVTLVGRSIYSASFFSKFCTKKLVSPRVQSKREFIGFLLNEVKKENYDLLMTLSDTTTEYLSEAREEFAKYVKFAIPDHQTVLRCLNKHQMFKFAQERNIPIPETYFVENVDQVDELRDKLRLPVVVKYPRGGGGSGNIYCKSFAEAKNAFRQLKEKYTEGSFNPLIQELVKGRQLDFYALCNHGKTVASFQYETFRSVPATGGNCSKTKSVNIKEFKLTAEKILSELNYHGIANMDFIQDEKTNQIKLVEVNPRFGGTTATAIIAGVDFPYLLFKMAVLNEEVQDSGYKNALLYRSVFFDEIMYALERKNMIPKLLIEFLDPRVRYDISFSDPKPLISQLRSAKWIIEGKIFNKVKNA